MSRDHYVSQTYLRHFCGDDGLLQRYYKNSPTPKATKRVPPKSVCYLPDGDTNDRFSDPRLVQKFLTVYENAWSEAISNATEDNYSPDIKEKIAAYIYYMQMMTPLGRKRLQKATTNSLQAMADVRYNGLLKKGIDKLTPQEKGFLIDYPLLGKGIKLIADESYCHAIAISILFNSAPHCGFTVSKWQFLINTWLTQYLARLYLMVFASTFIMMATIAQ